MNNTIPATGFLRLNQVLAVIPVGKSTWWNGVKSGRFPKSIKLGERTTAWRAEDIHTLISKLGAIDRQPGDNDAPRQRTRRRGSKEVGCGSGQVNNGS